MGPPVQKLDLGTKMIHIYRSGIKMTFVDGKVADIE